VPKQPWFLRRVVLVPAILAGGAIALAGAWQASAGIGWVVTAGRLDAAQEAYQQVGEQLAVTAAVARRDEDFASQLLDVAANGYVGAGAKSELQDAVETMTPILEVAHDLDREFESVEPASWIAWDLDSAIRSAAGQAAWFEEHLVPAEQTSDALETGTADLGDGAAAIYTSIEVVGAELGAANALAFSYAVADFDTSREDAVGSGLDVGGVNAVRRYVEAARVLQESHANEISGVGQSPEQKAAIAAFANSIAGGVALEFVWAPEVNGYGADGSMAGTATIDFAVPWQSTITLTESVAWFWDDASTVALVAHEVGHAVTNKCPDLFDASGGDHEAFATAWAIGMGYTDPGNGVSIYGRPSDAVIALAASCR
jgi:hypothetical protein